MSVYNVPFTSNLQMWSPSSSVTIDYNFNTTTVMPFSTTQVAQSRFFHHEPIMYPSACIICGLPHHPVPHTVMQYHTASPVITTPAPLEPTLSPTTLKSSTFKRRRSRRQIKPHKKIAVHIKYISTKLFKIFTFVMKAPLSNRRHNIYPVKRDRVD